MSEESQFISFRCPIALSAGIDELVDQGLYKDRTAFLIEAIRDKLNPEGLREQRKKQILHLLKQDPEIRKDLGL